LLAENNTYRPEQFDFTWQGAVLNDKFWGPIESGTHSLPNGNFMICEVRGRFFEINTLTNEIVWVYVNPVGDRTYNQYQNPDWTNTFRAEKYATGYVAFSNRNLSPQYLLEDSNSLSEVCNMPLNVTHHNNNGIQLIQQNKP